MPGVQPDSVFVRTLFEKVIVEWVPRFTFLRLPTPKDCDCSRAVEAAWEPVCLRTNKDTEPELDWLVHLIPMRQLRRVVVIVPVA